MAAIFVQRGRIGFDTTVDEVLGDFATDMHPGHRSTTLGQLLRHRAGLPPFEEDAEWAAVPKFQGSAAATRRAFVRWLLSRGPALSPGSRHVYSNAGYSVAAVMLEAVSGRPWEDLMAQELLTPLGITRFGFVWPIETGKPGTWGHRGVGDSMMPHDPAVDRYIASRTNTSVRQVIFP